LYSATATYGRMASDNEFVACRGSGIDIRRLFLPPLSLSLLVAFCTFYFTSFLIPGLVQDLNRIAREDLRQFVVQELESPKRLGFAGLPVRIYADRAAPSRKDPSAIVLGGVAFLEIGEEGYERFGTAESIVIRFTRPDGGPMAISGKFINATVFDERRGAWGDAGDQEFGPEILPQQIRTKLKWLDLPELLHLRRNPQDWPKVATALDATRVAILANEYRIRVMNDFRDDSRVTLFDENAIIDLRAEEAFLDHENNSVGFHDVTVTEQRDGRTRTITGAGADLSMSRSPDSGVMHGVIRLTGNVTVTDSSGRTVRKGREQLAGVAVDRAMVDKWEAVTDAQLLNPRENIATGDAAEVARARAIREAGKFVRRVGSELHSRLAFSISVLVLVVLGAALGITFRGSRVLVAFGISFVPALFVIVMNIMGRQLAEKDGTVLVGIMAVWGSIAVVALLDVWTMTRVVRR
ncbi:MAG: LptF/LptG family permease, partial [Phycisphaerae bacterium]